MANSKCKLMNIDYNIQRFDLYFTFFSFSASKMVTRFLFVNMSRYLLYIQCQYQRPTHVQTFVTIIERDIFRLNVTCVIMHLMLCQLFISNESFDASTIPHWNYTLYWVFPACCKIFLHITTVTSKSWINEFSQIRHS